MGAGGVPLALLRATSWGAVALLLLNPSCERSLGSRTVVLLDGSASMTDAGSDRRWHAAVDTAKAAAGRGGRILLFGGEPRVYRGSERPESPASALLPALREASARDERVVIVTDGRIDDAAALPADLLRAARIVVIAGGEGRPDAGVSAFDLPPILRSGDTAVAAVDVAVRGAAPGDSATLEIAEAGRTVARTRISLGAGGSLRREVSFVPAPVRAANEVRRYEARLAGFARDAEPRDDVLRTAAAVSQASAIALFSDAPDWDFRWLSQTLVAQSGVPVHAYIRLGTAGWRESRTMRVVGDAAVRAEASSASLIVAHGTEGGVRAMRAASRRAVFEWITVPSQLDAGPPADWYVATPELASPVGGALAGVPVESLPPLENVADLRPDSVAWTALVAQVDRRGRSRPVVVGVVRGGTRGVVVGASGLWRWASRGGVSAEGYRAIVAALTDWLLESRAPAPPGLMALRDSLAKGTAEFLPRRPALGAQPGLRVSLAGEPEPIRFHPWLYLVALAALVIEWAARRRRGLR